MTKQDAITWNNRYKNELYYTRGHLFPCSLLLENVNLLPKGGWILDIAMGAGRNAIFLEQKGFSVIGIDIAFEAVFFAKTNAPNLKAFVADLTEFHFPKSILFNGILNFYYLNRDLVKEFACLLKPGGVVFFETLTMPIRFIKPEISGENLLHEGELLKMFDAWEILYYREGWVDGNNGKMKSVASLIARLPG